LSASGSIAVAIAVLEHDHSWLLQLRDDDPAIVSPGCWGLFGGHLESSETPEEAIHRELLEEIGHQPLGLRFWYRSVAPGRVRHVFRGPLRLPVDQLRLNGGQDMALVPLDSIARGSVWSPRLKQYRTLAPSLQEALERHLRGG